MSKIPLGEKAPPKNDYKIENTTFVRKTSRNLTVDFVSLNTTEPGITLHSRPPITNPVWAHATALPLRNATNITNSNGRYKSKFTVHDIYKGYNPMVGIQTGGTLGSVLFLVLVYLLYKRRCRAHSDSESRRNSKVTFEDQNQVQEKRKPREGKRHELTLLLEKPYDQPNPAGLPGVEVNSFEATAEWVHTQPLDVRSLSDMSIVINIEDASATDDEADDLELEQQRAPQGNILGIRQKSLPSPIIEQCSDVGSVENFPVHNLQMQRNSIANPVSIPTIPTVTRHHKPRASSLKRPNDLGHSQSQSLCSNISNQKSRSSNTLHVRFTSDTMINKPKRKYRSSTSLRSNSCSSGSGSSRSSRSSRRSSRSSRSDISNRSDPSTKPLLKRFTDKFGPSTSKWFRSCDHLSVDYALHASGHSDPDEQTSMLKSQSMQNTAL